MRLLLDTHAFIWLAGDTSRLSPAARAAVADPANELLLSDASIWEMAIKVQLGKLVFPEPFDEKIFEALGRTQISILPIVTRHVAAVARLPLHHRDPFDRLLAVQAQPENLLVITHDPLLKQYDISLCW